MTLLPQGTDMAWLSNLVYEDWPIVEATLPERGFELLAVLDHNDTQAMLVSNRQWAGLNFRGTQASQVHTRDIFSNLGRPVRWAGRGRILSGYLHHLDMVDDRAWELVQDLPDDLPAFVGGHSLGGAVATGFASRRGALLAGLITFGAPKSLNREAANAIRCPIERNVMVGDLAPWHPMPWHLLSLSLVHPAKAHRLTPVKWWPPTTLARHSAGGYAAARALVG